LFASEVFALTSAGAVPFSAHPSLLVVVVGAISLFSPHRTPNMSIEIPKLKSRVAAFSNSLDELESVLEPLFTQSLPETVVNLEPLQQAKLQTDVPYVIYDLVFSMRSQYTWPITRKADGKSVVYLKLKGVDPKSHPVINELVCLLPDSWRTDILNLCSYFLGPDTTILRQNLTCREPSPTSVSSLFSTLLLTHLLLPSRKS
jgi:hypothetical protein